MAKKKKKKTTTKRTSAKRKTTKKTGEVILGLNECFPLLRYTHSDQI